MKQIHDFKPLLIGIDRYIPDCIIDRGLEYYEQCLVEDVQIKKPWIHATVLGNYGDYNVQVHMNDFSKSRCDCPYGDYCKHMAAVVYYVTREYTGKPGFNEPAGGTCECVADDETCAGAAETALQQQNHQKYDELDQCLNSMGKEDLLGIIKQLMETDPSNVKRLA
jgi:uncharacterized Zn finger protein